MKWDSTTNDAFENYSYGDTVDLSYRNDFNNLIRSLMAIEFNGESKICNVEQDAITLFNELHKKGNRIVQKYSLQNQLKYIFRKSAGLIVNIALILQIVKYYSGESKTTNLEYSTLQAADKIIDFFMAHFAKVWTALGKQIEDDTFIKIKKWILTHNQPMPIRKMLHNKIYKNQEQAEEFLLEFQSKKLGIYTNKEFHLI